MYKPLLPVLLLALGTACSPAGTPLPDTPDAALASLRTAHEEGLILFAANTLDHATLDVEVALDVRAANGIVALRPFDTIEALDAVPWVGESALGKLLDYATVHLDATWSAEDAQRIVRAANMAPESVLFALGLEAEAPHILDARPIADLETLAGLCHMDDGDFAALLQWDLDAPDCVPGTVESSIGLVYDDLDEAVLDTPPGGWIALCDGAYVLTVSTDLGSFRSPGRGAARHLCTSIGLTASTG